MADTAWVTVVTGVSLCNGLGHWDSGMFHFIRDVTVTELIESNGITRRHGKSQELNAVKDVGVRTLVVSTLMILAR